jgi:DNA-binding GntR family transcriptional regulator
VVDNGAVTETLRRDILEDVYPPGVRLVEADLCGRYGVSRAAVRSALLALAGEGLVDREANRGATVRRISVEEAIEITEVRQVLESLVAARAARNATAEDRAELQGIADRMRAAVAGEDVVAYGKLNAELHRALMRVSRHHEAEALVLNLRNRAVHHQFRLSLVSGRPHESLGQHEAIVAAVIAGDEDAAARAMTEHLASVLSVLRRWSEVSPRG